MYQNLNMRVPPMAFAEAKAKFLAAIAWAGAEAGHVSPREFNELLAGYLTTEHFAFIEAEAKLHHTLKEMQGALTNRQNEIAELIISGLTNKAIAETIHVSEATVHHEATKIYRIFSVANRGDLLAYFTEANEEIEQAQA